MAKKHSPHKLKPKQLFKSIPKSWVSFRTTKNLKPHWGTIGQERAMEAIDVGLALETRGFNIFASGEAGSGKTSTLSKLLKERAADETVPPDLCYVSNFKHTERPVPIFVPAGVGRELKREVEQNILELKRLVPRALSEGTFGHIKASIMANIRHKAMEATKKASAAAEKLGLLLQEEEDGLRVIPLVKGEPLDEATFESMTPKQRREIESKMLSFQKHLDAHAYNQRQLEREHHEQLLSAEVRAITPLVEELLKDLKKRFGKHGAELTAYFDAMGQHILEHHRIFVAEEDGEGADKEGGLSGALEIYEVNLVCDRTDQKGAPVIIERVPSPANLCGCIEYLPANGGLTTNHTMIRAGALHQAHGGYLLLQVSDLLNHESAWPSLKRALRHKEVRVEEAAGVGEGQRRLAGTMKPEPVAIDVKVILVGSDALYYTMKLQDEDFGRLFKVKAEFEPSMEKNKDNVNLLACFLGRVCRTEGYLPVHRSGFMKLVEMASRRVSHQDRMTTHQAELLDLVAEANYFAKADNARAIRQEDVESALRQIKRRHGAVADSVSREIREGTIIIHTDGEAVGQINGIALYDLAGVSFGIPVRITSRVYAGRRGVVNIDREVNLSGAIHDKGSLILVGYLGGRYAHEQTLGLSASITFEQSYDEIDGDSASSAELYALLSAISGCPINQGISVTGSVNQLGEVQPIGGVNTKIEGIFRICSDRGLTGKEGVMIPRTNMKNLMLSNNVIEAVRAGTFSIYAVSSVDEGIEILTGVPAGKRRKDGTWTPGSINDRVQKRLQELQDVVVGEGVRTRLDNVM